MSKKKKSKRRTVPAGRSRVVVFGGQPRMSEVILDLADPIVEDRRRKLFPKLRRFVLDYDLRVSEGRVELHVVSESMSENR